MMTFQELIVLLPCHSIEDFPTHHEGEEAEGLLAAWTALWDPRLIAAAGKMPSWERVDDPPEELSERLIVIPAVSESMLLAGWPARAKKEGACVVRRTLQREPIIQAALDGLGAPPREIDEPLRLDFLALGFAYLQEELLTRQMRYMSNLDEVHFQDEVTAAAAAAVAGDEPLAKRHLQNCFDVLAESRERFYPAESYLVDLTLVAESTLGASLRDQISEGLPANLLISGKTLDEMARREPETLAALKRAVQRGSATVVGGEWEELELPLLDVEEVLAQLKRGGRAYREHLGVDLEVFARRRFGLSPFLPQLLSRSGFTAALHFTLDEGRFPGDEQSKSTWEGVDNSTIEALSRIPLDISRPENFLSLCEKIGERMDMDHVATVVFAHWAGANSDWYDLLRRISSYAPVLGKFVTLAEFFRETETAGSVTSFSADAYRSPYLKQAIVRREADALSKIAGGHRRAALRAAIGALDTLHGIANESGGGAKAAEEQDETEESLGRRMQAGGENLAASMQAKPVDGPSDGRLIVNPLSFPRRVCLETPGLTAETGGAVKFAGGGKRPCAVIDVPAMGYVHLRPGRAATATSSEPPLADPAELRIRNEFFEVTVDRHTGAVRSLHDYHRRGNRLSQQIAHRQPGHRARPGDVWRDPDETADYSIMAADSVDVTAAGPVMAEIVSRGRLMSQKGDELAGFEQRVQVWRGSRVMLLDIDLDVKESPRADPWNCYYAARFAWPDSSVNVYRGVSLTRQPTEAKRLETPYFIEARTDKERTAILTGGLPYHRKTGLRMLDTMLIVRGDTARRFRLGVAIDHPQPLQAALELLSPPVIVPGVTAPAAGPAGDSFFNLDAKNVIATHWEILPGEAGRPVGVRVRLLETAGRATRAKLSTPRRAASPMQVDFRGERLADLPIEGETISVDFAAYEWAELLVHWEN